MKKVDWGKLYKQYPAKSYNIQELNKDVESLLLDGFVGSKKNIYEYLLGGKEDTRLLNIRVFPDAIKREVYNIQTTDVKDSEGSNCPLCVVGKNANKAKNWKFFEMDADHVTSWSRGGSTDKSNCEMLCITHNRAKGNK